jgi:murein DD-endopeptidase MepM/ murein hydrolase activator NlpD
MRMAAGLPAALAGAAILMLATAAVAQGPDDGYFDWPMGRVDSSGGLVMGHDLYVLYGFAGTTQAFAPRPHGGIDFQWLPRGGETRGPNTIGAPVYAAANGEVVCENFIGPYNSDYPGRVVVIRHSLPGGQVLYTQYAHLRYPPGRDPVAGREAEDPGAVPVGAKVRRGDRIGTVIENPDDVTNSHLHFEVRDFERWGENCAGPGYAQEREDPRDKGWIDPVDFYYQHRPRGPGPVVLWSSDPRNIRAWPSTNFGRVIGQLAPSSRATAFSLYRERRRQNWWYLIFHQGRPGWVNGFEKQGENGDLAIGEPRRTDSWRRTLGRPLIHYRFDVPALFARGLARNSGVAGPGFEGLIEGEVAHVPGPEAVLFPGRRNNRAIRLDGVTAFVEASNSESLGFANGVAVRAMVRRKANADEDAILSKWYADDQWLLTFYPSAHGQLIFTVRLADGRYVTVSHLPPDPSYLGQWVRVAASYEIVDELPYERYGMLRLYWGDALVAEQRVDGAVLTLRPTNKPIHVGDAGIGTPWSRFDGDIDDVQIWRVEE